MLLFTLCLLLLWQVKLQQCTYSNGTEHLGTFKLRALLEGLTCASYWRWYFKVQALDNLRAAKVGLGYAMLKLCSNVLACQRKDMSVLWYTVYTGYCISHKIKTCVNHCKSASRIEMLEAATYPCPFQPHVSPIVAARVWNPTPCSLPKSSQDPCVIRKAGWSWKSTCFCATTSSSRCFEYMMVLQFWSHHIQ